MSGQMNICSLTPESKEKCKKFKMRRDNGNCAIVFKIDSEKCEIIEDGEYEDVTVDDLQEELPHHSPRYIIYSYKQQHSDGRVSYPLCFIFISPSGANPELSMLYAGSKNEFVRESGVTKIFELRSIEEMTEEWLLSKLQLFR